MSASSVIIPMSWRTLSGGRGLWIYGPGSPRWLCGKYCRSRWRRVAVVERGVVEVGSFGEQVTGFTEEGAGGVRTVRATQAG